MPKGKKCVMCSKENAAKYVNNKMYDKKESK